MQNCFADKQLPNCPASIPDARLPLIELYDIPVGSFLQPVQVPLKGDPALDHLDCFDCFPQFGDIHKFVDNTLCPIIQIVKEDVKKQHWSQYQSFRDPNSYWVRPGLTALSTTPQTYTPDYNCSKLNSSCRSENFCVWKVLLPRTEAAVAPLKQCRRCRAEPASSEVSCYASRPYIFFYVSGRDKFIAGINQNSLLGWCWRGTDNPGSSTPPSRGFIPVNSITLDWSGQDKPQWASFF